MRRILVFALLGPPLGFVMVFYVLGPAMNWLLGGSADFGWQHVVMLPMAYAIGILPALLTALVDAVLAGRGIRRRLLWTALFGFAASFLPLAGALAAGYIAGEPLLLVWGLVGAVPAYVCSRLAGPAIR
jgi:hypothetical protein